MTSSVRRRPLWRRLLAWWPLWLVLVVLAAWIWHHRFGVPDDYDHMEDQFKYGSIGADHPLAQAPLPYWLWKVLPEVVPPHDTRLPEALRPAAGRPGWAAFGLYVEPTMPLPRGAAPVPAGTASPIEPPFERPIGVSKRRVAGLDFVGLNCAFCHQGTLKTERGLLPILGGTGQDVDIELYFLYLFSAFQDERFSAANVMPKVEAELKRQNASLGWFTKALYRWVLIPLLPRIVGGMEVHRFDFIDPRNPKRLPEFGPGRVDTWGLYKRVFMDPPVHDSIPGTVDFPPLWNQTARVGWHLHWDGNTDVLVERNVISALSIVGRRIEYLDYERLTRVTDWIMGLLPPRYQDLQPAAVAPVDAARAARGADLFGQHCARCHSPQGDRIGRVEPIAGLGTDPNRIAEFLPGLADALNKLGTSQWQLRNFRVQNGYVNTLLDGVWLRAPYLHNGSVPTLRDLLNPPAERPPRFCRGRTDYDWQRLGWVWEPVAAAGPAAVRPCGPHYLYDTATPGNSNAGHTYGTTLPDDDKAALLEFLKTL